MNGLRQLRDVLRDGFETGQGEVLVDEGVAVQAYQCIDRMLAFAKAQGATSPRGQLSIEHAHQGIGPA